MRLNSTPDRYEAAIRLERARATVRLGYRYNLPVTRTDIAEVVAAEEEYDLATAAKEGP